MPALTDGSGSVQALDYLVDAMAHPSEARMFTRYVCGERCLHRFREQWLTGELASSRANLACRHRLSGSLEHQRHGLEYRAHPGGNRPRFARIGLGFAEQLVVDRAEPRELNPGSRVRTCLRVPENQSALDHAAALYS